MSEPVAIEIPQFQMQGMLCGEDTVRLRAFDALYKVHLDQSRRPVRYEVARGEAGKWPILPGGNQSRLGGFGFQLKGLALERTLVMNDASGHEFAIEIEPKLSGPDQCHPEITTRLVEFDASRKVVRERVLFRGTAFGATAPCIAPD